VKSIEGKVDGFIDHTYSNTGISGKTPRFFYPIQQSEDHGSCKSDREESKELGNDLCGYPGC